MQGDVSRKVVYAGARIRGTGENVYFENMLIIM